jgi:hypothetical protein
MWGEEVMEGGSNSARGKYCDMFMKVDTTSASASHSAGAKERVSFGTNTSMDDESSDGRLVQDSALTLDTALAMFHARKFGTKESGAVEKRVTLKVHGIGNTKKHKTPVKENVKDWRKKAWS